LSNKHGICTPHSFDENKKNMTKFEPIGVNLEERSKPPKVHGDEYE